MLQPRNVIRVPHRDEAKALPEYNTGHDVLALYPGTTCFYRAKVMAPPSKVSVADRVRKKETKHYLHFRIKMPLMVVTIRSSSKTITMSINMSVQNMY
jgi:hypothetical protein